VLLLLHWQVGVLLLLLHMWAEVLLLGRAWEMHLGRCCFITCAVFLAWALDTSIHRLHGTCTAA
jgi:hypothetical protein